MHTFADLPRRYYAALTHGHLDQLDTLLTTNFVEHEVLPGIPPTRDGLKQKYALLRGGFSDLAFHVEDTLISDDRVAVRVTVSGTHDGAFMGRPASGRRFAVSSVSIFRVADQRLAEHWGVFDQLSMLAQLGALAPAA